MSKKNRMPQIVARNNRMKVVLMCAFYHNARRLGDAECSILWTADDDG